jgi:hypothetical protein
MTPTGSVLGDQDHQGGEDWGCPKPSIGSVGDAYDNALTQCGAGHVVQYRVHPHLVFHAGPYRTIAEVEYATTGGRRG